MFGWISTYKNCARYEAIHKLSRSALQLVPHVCNNEVVGNFKGLWSPHFQKDKAHCYCLCPLLPNSMHSSSCLKKIYQSSQKEVSVDGHQHSLVLCVRTSYDGQIFFKKSLWCASEEVHHEMNCSVLHDLFDVPISVSTLHELKHRISVLQYSLPSSQHFVTSGCCYDQFHN